MSSASSITKHVFFRLEVIETMQTYTVSFCSICTYMDSLIAVEILMQLQIPELML